MKAQESSDYQKRIIGSRLREKELTYREYRREQRAKFWETHRERIVVILGFAAPLVILPFLLYVVVIFISRTGIDDFFEDLFWESGFLMIIAKALLLASLVSTLIFVVKRTRDPTYRLGQLKYKESPEKIINEPSTIDYVAMYGRMALVGIGIALIVGFGVGSLFNFIYPQSALYVGGWAGFWSLAVIEKLEKEAWAAKAKMTDRHD